MFGNKERRRKEKRKMNIFSFLCLVCNKKGNEKKIYVFFFTFMPIKM